MGFDVERGGTPAAAFSIPSTQPGRIEADRESLTMIKLKIDPTEHYPSSIDARAGTLACLDCEADAVRCRMKVAGF